LALGKPTKYVYIKSTTVYVPSSELGLSHPLSRQRVCPSPVTEGRGWAHSPAGEGLGESQFRRLSTLPTLCLLFSHLSAPLYQPTAFSPDNQLGGSKKWSECQPAAEPSYKYTSWSPTPTPHLYQNLPPVHTNISTNFFNIIYYLCVNREQFCCV
jgi:hypothetical protein